MNPHPSIPFPRPARRGARAGFLPRLALFACAAAAALGAGGCAANEPVKMAQVAEIPPMSFSRLWAADLELKGDRVKQVFVRDELIFVYTKQNMSYAFKRSGGELAFASQAAPPGTTLYPPVVLADTVVYPTPATFYVFSKLGRPLPNLSLPFPMRSAATGYPAVNRVFYGSDSSNGGRVVALDMAKKTGSLLPTWSYITRGGLSPAPAFYQGLVYEGCEDGSVAAVNAENGSAVWPLPDGLFRTYGPVKADVKADDYGVYIASGDGTLYCVDRIAGRVRWDYHAGSPLYKSPVVSPTTAYIVVEGKGLVAVDKIAGDYNRKPRWAYFDGVQFLAEDDKFSYVLNNSNAIVALDRLTGVEKFRAKRRDFVAYGSNVSGGTIKGPPGILYGATAAGQLYAISPVLKSGTTGEMVMDFEARPVEALAMGE